VVEQPPCKRQVVCSIQTGGTILIRQLARFGLVTGHFIKRFSNATWPPSNDGGFVPPRARQMIRCGRRCGICARD
jgi:hypothetical protein